MPLEFLTTKYACFWSQVNQFKLYSLSKSIISWSQKFNNFVFGSTSELEKLAVKVATKESLKGTKVAAYRTQAPSKLESSDELKSCRFHRSKRLDL